MEDSVVEHIQMLPLAAVPKKNPHFLALDYVLLFIVSSGASLPEQPISRSQCPEETLFSQCGLGGSCWYHTFLGPGLTGQASYGSAMEERVLGKFLCSE